MSVAEGKVVGALADAEMSPTEIALTTGLDIRVVRKALSNLFERGLVQSQYDLDVELWRLA